MFHLAPVWGKVGKALPTVRMVPDENHRERVLAAEEETLHFAGAKSEAMNQHMDARPPFRRGDHSSGLRSSARRVFSDAGAEAARSKFGTARPITPAVEFP